MARQLGWQGKEGVKLTAKMSAPEITRPLLVAANTLCYLVLSAYFKSPHTNDFISSSAQPCEINSPGIISNMFLLSLPCGSLQSPQIVSSILETPNTEPGGATEATRRMGSSV